MQGGQFCTAVNIIAVQCELYSAVGSIIIQCALLKSSEKLTSFVKWAVLESSVQFYIAVWKYYNIAPCTVI